jgi:hypothetical protein
MRFPFDFNSSNLNEDARIKFIYNSPELHQNVEVSLDGDKTSVDAIIDAFERFLGALGVSIPENVCLQFVKIKPSDKDDDDDYEDDDEEEEDK